jgi:hypothetical protein
MGKKIIPCPRMKVTESSILIHMLDEVQIHMLF